MNEARATTAIAGVGQMGLAMALRLRDGGRAVRVHDIDTTREALAQAAGAEPAVDAATLARDIDLLIVAVVDAAQTHALLFGDRGAAAAMSPGACVMLCPTIAAADVEAIAARLATQGIDCIDAPMSGGPARARDGTMSLMVACADALFVRHEPLLRHLASRLLRVGLRLGDGARTKLVNNLLAAVNLAGAAEAMALAQRLGLDSRRTLEVIEQSSGQSWIGGDRMRRALQGDFEPRAKTSLLAKDTRLALALAAAAGIRPALGVQAAAMFDAALAAGYADDDDARLLSLLLQAWPLTARSAP